MKFSELYETIHIKDLPKKSEIVPLYFQAKEALEKKQNIEGTLQELVDFLGKKFKNDIKKMGRGIEDHNIYKELAPQVEQIVATQLKSEIINIWVDHDDLYIEGAPGILAKIKRNKKGLFEIINAKESAYPVLGTYKTTGELLKDLANQLLVIRGW